MLNEINLRRIAGQLKKCFVYNSFTFKSLLLEICLLGKRAASSWPCNIRSITKQSLNFHVGRIMTYETCLILVGSPLMLFSQH